MSDILVFEKWYAEYQESWGEEEQYLDDTAEAAYYAGIEQGTAQGILEALKIVNNLIIRKAGG